MVLLDDKLFLNAQCLKESKGILRITKVLELREAEGNFGKYRVLDIEVMLENGEGYKYSLFEKERAFLIPKLGRDTDKWENAQLIYKVVTKVTPKGEQEAIKIENAVPSCPIEEVK